MSTSGMESISVNLGFSCVVNDEWRIDFVVESQMSLLLES